MLTITKREEKKKFKIITKYCKYKYNMLQSYDQELKEEEVKITETSSV